jgi:ADP-sugar diphosphatase
MIDDSGTFGGAAAKEIAEETGLEIPEKELIDMTKLALPQPPDSEESLQQAFYPSAGGSDEFVPLFLWQKRVPRDQLKDWQGKLTGLRDEGEKITLMLVKLEDVWKAGGRDSKALAGWAFYEGLRKEGRI